MVNLEQRISQWLEHWQIGTAPKEKTGQKTGIVVGLSGGADSVSLLLLLQSAAQERGLELTAVHVHHGIRGAEADRDAAFAKQLCEQYGISFHCEHVDIPALAAAQGWTLEEAGRKERYRIFEEIRQEAGASWIAVAHQKQDQAETMLFHLVRGRSLRGMGGIRPVSGRIIRPLLDTDRTELEQWLRNKGISWCEDSTNREPDASRNVLRLSIIPQLRQLQPDLEGVLSQEAALFAEAADYLSSQAEAEFRAQQTGQQSEAATAEPAGQKSVISLSVSRLQELHPALRREVLYRALWEAAGAKKDLTAHHVELLLRLCSLQSGRRLMLPYEVEVEREYDRLYFKRQTSEQENRDRCERKIRADIRILDGAEARKIAENDCTKCFDYANIEEIPMFRHKRPGDRIILYADGRGKKLQDLLTDRKIPARKRDQLLVLASGSEVLWIPGIRRSAGHRVGEQTEQAVVVRMSEEEKEKLEELWR